MPLFIDGKMPNERDQERLKLLLSTYTDGSGENEGGTLPGGFNFERAAAEWMDGVHIPGTKHIYDVVVHEYGRIYGYSCKMRGTLRDAYRKEALSPAASQDEDEEEGAPVPEGASELTGYCLIEVSNAGAKFLGMATDKGITKDNITEDTPERREALREIGEAIVAEINKWHHEATPPGHKKAKKRKAKKGDQSIPEVPEERGPVFEQGSLMLHLAWSKLRKGKPERKAKKKGAPVTPAVPAVPAEFQLFVFDRHIATKSELAAITWKGRMKVRGGKQTATLYGTRPSKNGAGEEVAIEIYLFSGGHVKYFPRAEDAIWVSDRFSLLEAPKQTNILATKALALFPKEWLAANGADEKLAEAVAETVQAESVVERA